MPDRRHDRRTAGGDRPYELLVGERQQVLHAAAAARHDDHVDLVQRVQLLDRLDDLRHRVHALHGDVAHLEADGRPAAPGVLQYVPLGGRGPAAHQPDQLRQEGQRLLALRREQPLGGQRPSSAAPAGRAARRRRPAVSRWPAATAARAARTTRAWRARRRARPPLTTSATASKTCRIAGHARRRCRARGRAASGTRPPRPAAATAG